ncbi:23S rRNA (guanosine(2251)-2'-O)-methyltransferase RlmB [Desulfosporosinus sp.]|uniref:23S rRNA (guanosine(2251)-2'-O)-methyltransferase RlmB n=1 Tax=Desulfosporosinus sp. TaxID=157907 RepID=UPI00231437E7|nr:23S rRNA (guanosine(2251)-2'-O)-methyltransferase RlmB [Desulfosporosinus sp.]MDA8220730.1 23S rRNA (guanosine(2251)-2'-O)-methyltransferase RlmB [Desulfitobacterium hafniense]
MNYLNEEMVYGKNPVVELLKSGKPVNKVLLVTEGAGSRNQEIISLLHERNIPYQFVDRQTLDRLTNRERHQGMLAYVAAREYASVEDILALAEERQEAPFILMLDEIEDPHNLGALLRTVNAVGAHGVIIPKRRSVALTGTVAKTSAGAVEHVMVARVSNLVQTLNDLKKKGCWVSGAEAGGKDAFKADLTGPRVIVIGSEGKGISRLLRENCDEIVSLPMKGKITSLNASVAGSVMLYEVLRQRNYSN